MRILRFDSVGGASGDMILGALMDIGVDPGAVTEAVESLGVTEFRIDVEEAADGGLRGKRVTVHRGHERHGHHHGGHGEHRGLMEILGMLARGRLGERARQRSETVFRRLAEAEGQVHGIEPEQVHFHEVGAVDAIVDIVGSCVGLDLLGVDCVTVGPLPLGTGHIEAAHGVLPVPAPATVALLRGRPVVMTDEPFELVTPTGAALLSTWAREQGSLCVPGGVIGAVGYGVGHRSLHKRANVLRATQWEAGVDEGDAAAGDCVVLECTLDDMPGEWVGAMQARLWEAGALEVYVTGVQMKKQRPGVLVTVLCEPDARAGMIDVLFRESTTFGVRERLVRRTVLVRRAASVATAYGAVGVKVGRWRGEDVTASPEYEDCAAAARAADVPVKQVYEAAMAAWWRGRLEPAASSP